MQVPSGETEKAAVEALKAEVRCIGRTRASDEGSSTTMGRLKAELNRLQVSSLVHFVFISGGSALLHYLTSDLQLLSVL